MLIHRVRLRLSTLQSTVLTTDREDPEGVGGIVLAGINATGNTNTPGVFLFGTTDTDGAGSANAPIQFRSAIRSGTGVAAPSTSDLACWFGFTTLKTCLAVDGSVALHVTSASFGWTGRSLITSPADGDILLTANAGSGFTRLSFGDAGGTSPAIKRTGNSELSFKTSNDGAYADIDAGFYKGNGQAITSATGPTFLSNGSGMAVANVGVSSCGTSAASIAGNNNAFVITVGATAGTQCRVAFTFAAGTEWDCAANDDTTTVAVRTTPFDTTHTDLIGSFTAGDKVTGICFPR